MFRFLVVSLLLVLYFYKVKKVFPSPYVFFGGILGGRWIFDVHEPSVPHFLISPEKHTSFPVAAKGPFGMCRPEVNAT